MKNNSDERIILLIIKYTPPFFIILLSIVMSFILFENSNSVYEKEKDLTNKHLIENHKEIVKNEVIRLYRFLDGEANSVEKNLKKNLKSEVNQAYATAMNIYKENKNLKKELVIKLIKDALRNVRFNSNRGYFFIHSMDGECILFPIDSKFEGESFSKFSDKKGLNVFKEVVRRLKKSKSDTFITYWFYKPNDFKEQHKKITYAKYFEPFDWFIGAGEYIEDFEEDIKKQIGEKVRNLNSANNINDYYFVLDSKGNYLSHKNGDKIGKNASISSYTSQSTIKMMQKEARDKKALFITYLQDEKPGTDISTNKTSYLMHLKKWDWFIGKGFYEDDINNIIKVEEKTINKKFRTNLTNLIIITVILTIVLLFISLYMSNFLKKKFKNYRLEIDKNLNEITKQQDILAQQSKMAAIGTMIGNIAHQWRQPLSLISTIATGAKLKKELASLSDEEFSEGMDNINKTTQYLSKTIDDFRNFFNSNKIKKEFTIKEAFENCFNLVSVQFKNHDIEIIKDIGESQIYGIQTELVQVLINILNNSRDELLKLDRDKKKYIFIKTKEIDDNLLIMIKDNAGGVDEEIIENIFEPYFTTKHQSQGTGIGLYMSEEIIVKHMRGTINIENSTYEYEGEEYKGALTTIRLSIYK